MLQFWLHRVRLVVESAVRTIPFPLGLGLYVHTGEVEPLHRAELIVAADHVPKGNLLG